MPGPLRLGISITSTVTGPAYPAIDANLAQDRFRICPCRSFRLIGRFREIAQDGEGKARACGRPSLRYGTLRLMDLGLTDRRFLVTGASRGLGSAVARALAAEGARLALGARPSDALSASAKQLGAHAVPVDLSEAGGAPTAVRWRR